MFRLLLTALFLLTAFASTHADIQLPSLISDNMVLQRSAETALWGRAAAGEKIVARFGNASGSTTADEKGAWRLAIDLRQAPATAGDLVIQGTNTITIRNAVVGEVWLCSGQSNMWWTVDGTAEAGREPMDLPMIRHFVVAQKIATEPVGECEGKWVVATPQTAMLFTAVGFYFGREIHQRTGHAVGLINATWGGTGAEAWTSESQMKADPDLAAMFVKFRTAMQGNTPEAATLRNDPSMPSVLYCGMIAPLTRYRIRGTIWYQGEGNELRWQQYEKLLTLMINGWRHDWNQGDFPFYIVQLAGFREKSPEPSADDGWVRIRQAQSAVARTIPNSGLATAIDIGDAKDIHPKNKLDVGKRLAAIAMAKDYGGKEEYSGPLLEKTARVGNKIRLTFSHAAGLNARDGALKGFAIAGPDGQFLHAKAQIDGESVLVWSDQLPAPITVRYAWAANPDISLYNKANLPAPSFEAVVDSAR